MAYPWSFSLPFRAQHAHDNGVPVSAIVELILAKYAFLPEADLFVTANAALIVFVDVQLDAIQVQGLEAELDERTRDFLAVRLAPAGFVANGDAEFSLAMTVIDLKESRDADGEIAVLADNKQTDGALVTGDALNELDLAVQRHRAMLADKRPNFWIVDPGLHRGSVFAFQSAVVQTVTDQERVLHPGNDMNRASI
jgi:hypothetical protein